MPIRSVRTRRVSAPLRETFSTSRRRTATTDTLVVEIIDDQGRSGFGEVPQAWQTTGTSVAGAEACVNEMLSPILIGRDADDIGSAYRALRTAVAPGSDARASVAAADIALHDLAARRADLPLSRFLGGVPSAVATDVTISIGGPDAMAATAVRRCADGFTALKLKIGLDATGELDGVRAVRDAVGAAVTLRLDANQGWTPKDAVRIIRRIEDAGLGVELVEQPVAGDDLRGLAWVTSRVDTPILADEALRGPRDLHRILETRAADLVNVKISNCGGLTPAWAMLAFAEANGLGTLVGTMMETQINVTAAAALAGAAGTTHVSDLDAAWWLETSPLRSDLTYDAGRIQVPDAPGLGVTWAANR